MRDEMRIRLQYYDKAQDVKGDILEEYREFWNEIFHDPEDFTNYYFGRAGGKNRLLGAYMDGALIGMLHMNPYAVQMEAELADCYYIVGVAVRESMRRQGIMKLMMQRAIDDMRSEKCPMAFLMPKRQEYYTGFGFEMVYDTRVLRADVNRLVEQLSNEVYTGIYKIESMHEYTLDELVGLSREINICLGERYSFYALRTVSYMTDMFEEHYCQNGGVCVVREQGGLRCIFSYDVYDRTMYVERYEPLGGNTLHMLREILCFAAACGCGSIEITVPACESACIESGWREYMRKGVIGLTEGCGIMALVLTGNGNKMKNASFFDEIV